MYLTWMASRVSIDQSTSRGLCSGNPWRRARLRLDTAIGLQSAGAAYLVE